MNFQPLERIMLVAKIGNITEAAKKLYVSQSALSQMISTVEAELGTPIFDRRVKPLRLTKAGERYILMARHVVNAHSAMLNEIDNLKSGTTGTISCGISARRSRDMLPQILYDMSVAFPQISLCLSTSAVSEYESLLLRGDLDISFGSLPPNDPSIGSFALNDEKYMLIAQRDSPFARRLDEYRFSRNDPSIPIKLSEARAERFITAQPQTESRNVFNAMCEEAHIRPLIAIEAYNSDVALEYTRIGLGVSVVATSFSNRVPFAYQTDQISFFNITSKYAHRHLYLNYDKSVIVSLPHRHLVNLILESYGGENTAPLLEPKLEPGREP